jgi:hypothetical protein
MNAAVLRLGLGVGLCLAVLYTIAPLPVLVVGAAVVVFAAGLRDLPADERRALTALLTIAVALRLLAVAAMFFRYLPYHYDGWLGELSGDGAYGVSRALRARDLLLGVPTNKYDGFVVTDMYGANLFVSLVTVLTVLFGPVPYGLRLLNILMFVTGAFVMFRIARRAYGWLPAAMALTFVLFLPSFVAWSISLLKEPLYFLLTTIFLAGASGSLRSGSIARRIANGAFAVAALAGMDGVRHQTWLLGLLGWGIALGLVIVLSRPRVYLPIVAAGLAVFVVAAWPRIGPAGLRALEATAKIHTGHVMTLGHEYKLLDPGFYYLFQNASTSTMTLTYDEAARYVLRALTAFIVVPLPWQMASIRELAIMPEQLLWYGLVAMCPIGIVAGWRRDAPVTAVIVGYLLTTSLVIALTNGNVGTLVRLRGIVTIIVVWISAVGLCSALEAVLSRAPRSVAPWRAIRPEAAS